MLRLLPDAKVVYVANMHGKELNPSGPVDFFWINLRKVWPCTRFFLSFNIISPQIPPPKHQAPLKVFAPSLNLEYPSINAEQRNVSWRLPLISIRSNRFRIVLSHITNQRKPKMEWSGKRFFVFAPFFPSLAPRWIWQNLLKCSYFPHYFKKYLEPNLKQGFFSHVGFLCIWNRPLSLPGERWVGGPPELLSLHRG